MSDTSRDGSFAVDGSSGALVLGAAVVGAEVVPGVVGAAADTPDPASDAPAITAAHTLASTTVRELS
ncbi:hypothetical protein [Gordonia hydrophobica]|uniref:Uncharacterized protein n=1 Tax=Gordonia hydrophobica TaxID=40516 RepID=A0ABZ2U3P3_9ACTN|nr:hypothetical protein [Gordonia hydrophobica]MBM7367930.1 hypothetical protein [Gordonia hydrophobica]